MGYENDKKNEDNKRIEKNEDVRKSTVHYNPKPKSEEPKSRTPPEKEKK